MRVAFFGSGSPLSVIALRAVAQRHEVSAVVYPERELGPAARLLRMVRRAPDEPLITAAKEIGAKRLAFERGRVEQLRRELLKARPNLIVVASFPALLPQSLIGAAALGGVNLHQSLLPRGRGPDPIFWSYYDDDRELGSTVHWLDEQFDGGDIIAQSAMPIARGRPSSELYFDIARLGGEQLVEAITAIENGTAPRTPQDPALATYRPSPLKEPWRLRFDVWPAERTWHFLRGVGDMFGRFARGPQGEPFPIGAALSFSIDGHGRQAGTYERIAADRVRLYCADGFVDARS